jgi:molybdate/tungstate transport system substrate-binding protein
MESTAVIPRLIATRCVGRSADAARTSACATSLIVLLLCPLAAASPQDRTVSVLYAGSLGAVMEKGVGPAFVQATGFKYEGEAQGSLGAARMIRDRVRTPDVFVSADPSVNETVLMGPQNGNLVRWYMILASSSLVIGYNPNGKFAAKFQEAAMHKVPWYEILETPGVRFGRGDPSIDPKGYRTLFLFRLASQYYRRPELAGFLGDPANPAQVFPEIVLMGRVESGQFDAGIFYKHELSGHQLSYIDLPPEINLGDPRFADSYARESYTTPAGEHMAGSPILLTVTILENVRHREAGLAFVRFLLSSGKLLNQFGLGNVEHQVGGDVAQVPPELRAFCAGAFKL